MEKKLLTSNELADKLRVHPHTIRLWAKSGKIPFIRLSARDFRYVYEDVLEALK